MDEALARGLIPEGVHSLVRKRLPIAAAGMERAERASGIRYPAAYVEPSAVVSRPDQGSFQYGILFARTIPLEAGGRMRVVVQVSAPLVAFGLRGTVHAILAHEFLHYLELSHRASRMGVISDEVTGSVFESVHADGGRLFEPGAVFGDRTLVAHITKRFPEGFRDARLEDKTVRLWIGRGLPRTSVDLGSNVARLPAGAIARAGVDPALAERLEEMRLRSDRIRRRRRATGRTP